MAFSNLRTFAMAAALAAAVEGRRLIDVGGDDVIDLRRRPAPPRAKAAPAPKTREQRLDDAERLTRARQKRERQAARQAKGMGA